MSQRAPIHASAKGRHSSLASPRRLFRTQGSRAPATQVVKISYPHPGNADECRALALWNGDGAVRLLDSDPAKLALLLERVEDRQLDVLPYGGIAIGGQLLAHLAVAAPTDMKRLADTATEWEQQVRDDEHQAGHPLPGRVLDAAIATIRDLGHDTTATMLHGGLHGGNILHSERGWVVNDPKAWLALPPTTP